jgi:hypothetical protein
VGGTLRLAVENTGPAGKVPAGSGYGIGLGNTRGRLAQLSRGRYGLSMGTDSGGRTTVSIELPLHTTPEIDPAELRAAAEALGTVPEGTGLTGEHPVREAPTRGTLADPMLRWFVLLWAGVAALWTAQRAIGQRLTNGLTAGLTSDLTSGSGASRVELLSALLWALATPGVLWLGRAVRVRQGHWRGTIAVHVVASVLLGAAQIALVRRVTGPRPSVFGDATANQLVVDVMLYAAIVAWAHAREFGDWYRERALAAARLQHEIEQTRLQSVALDVRPHLIVRLLDRMADVVAIDAARGERMAERMADLLRRLLDSAGQTTHAVRDQLALMRLGAELHTLATSEPVRIDVRLDPAWLDRRLAPPGFAGALDGVLGRPTSARAIAVIVALAAARLDGGDRVAITADVPLTGDPVSPDDGERSGYRLLVTLQPAAAPPTAVPPNAGSLTV